MLRANIIETQAMSKTNNRIKGCFNDLTIQMSFIIMILGSSKRLAAEKSNRENCVLSAVSGFNHKGHDGIANNSKLKTLRIKDMN